MTTKAAVVSKFSETIQRVTRSTSNAGGSSSTFFGGQPQWINEPQWPVSKKLKKPMSFICQVDLNHPIFASQVKQTARKMRAYVFMTDEKDDYVDGTWEYGSGENGVIVQVEGEKNNPSKYFAINSSLSTGPTHSDTVFFPVFTEVQVPLAPKNEESEEEDEDADDDERLSNTHLGGKPSFIQHPEYPSEDANFFFTAQLSSTDFPFFVNFGDCGDAYVYLRKDLKEAVMFWQCG